MSYIDQFKRTVMREAPLLMSVGAIFGFGGALYAAIHATPKAHAALEEAELESEFIDHTPTQRLFAMAKVVLPIYAPTIGLTATSIFLVLAANSTYRRRNQALIFAGESMRRTLHRLEGAVGEKVSDKVFDEILSKAHTPQRNPDPEVVINNEKVVVYDEFSDRYFQVPNVETIVKAVADINERIRSEGFVPLNDYYYDLGLKPLPFGNELGWCVDNGPFEIRITSTMIGNSYTPCVAIFFSVEPRFL